MELGLSLPRKPATPQSSTYPTHQAREYKKDIINLEREVERLSQDRDEVEEAKINNLQLEADASEAKMQLSQAEVERDEARAKLAQLEKSESLLRADLMRLQENAQSESAKLSAGTPPYPTPESCMIYVMTVKIH